MNNAVKDEIMLIGTYSNRYVFSLSLSHYT